VDLSKVVSYLSFSFVIVQLVVLKRVEILNLKSFKL
jgi:hypothetical protein